MALWIWIVAYCCLNFLFQIKCFRLCRCENPSAPLTDLNTVGVCVRVRLCVQVLFACAEALYAHGYSNEACRLAVELARDLLANPPDLKVEQPQTKVDTAFWNTFTYVL